MTTIAPSRATRQGIGESATRPDAVPKVRGSFAYASDLRAEGMLHGRTVRSTVAHARIVLVDVRAAADPP